jgi:type IV pilus assembly protein PilF
MTQKIDEAVDHDASYHVVVLDENLYRISLRYNVKMNYLMQWNNLDDPSAIIVGMKLRVKDPKNND